MSRALLLLAGGCDDEGVSGIVGAMSGTADETKGGTQHGRAAKGVSMRRQRSRWGTGAAALVLALAAAGCGGVDDELCQRAAACAGDGTVAVAACVDAMDQRQQLASAYDCDESWDDYVACRDEMGACAGGAIAGCDGLDAACQQCLLAHGLDPAATAGTPLGGAGEPDPVVLPTGENDGAPKPKTKCSLSPGSLGSEPGSAPVGWGLSALLALAWLGRRRCGRRGR